MLALAAEWDTLGWVYFKQCAYDSGGDKSAGIAKAEKYISASWELNQRAGVAEHLGELYSKSGRREAAIRMWRFALALDPAEQEAKDRLRTAGVSKYPRAFGIPRPVSS